MGSKYTSQSASGYDANPPNDDGTVSEANRGKWATIKSKLANVLKTFIEGVNTQLVTTLDTSPRSLAASGSTASTDHWRTIEVTTASVVITLAAAASMTAGYIVNVANQSSGNIVVACQSSDTIDTVTNTTQTIPAKACREYIVNTGATGYITKSGQRHSLPTTQVLTSGSGTYVTPAFCSRIWVRMVGGGGGAGGSNTAGATNGGTGGSTTFSSFTAVGGGGGLAGTGAATAAGGAGGTASGGTLNLSGGSGTGSGAPLDSAGGCGAASPFGGGGGGGIPVSQNGSAGATNTGGGGGGGGGSSGTFGGGGGGAGAYIEGWINSPATNYSYGVGAAGSAGSGNGAANGGAGGSGIIIVAEFYD